MLTAPAPLYGVVREKEISTGLFVTVAGEEAVLQERELRNVCRFEVWQRQVRTTEHATRQNLRHSYNRRWQVSWRPWAVCSSLALLVTRQLTAICTATFWRSALVLVPTKT